MKPTPLVAFINYAAENDDVYLVRYIAELLAGHLTREAEQNVEQALINELMTQILEGNLTATGNLQKYTDLANEYHQKATK